MHNSREIHLQPCNTETLLKNDIRRPEECQNENKMAAPTVPRLAGSLRGDDQLQSQFVAVLGDGFMTQYGSETIFGDFQPKLVRKKNPRGDSEQR